jgi:ParB-like chromosome segregation protein Spo0J
VIYGDTADQGLVDSVKNFDVIEDVVVVPDPDRPGWYIIISGHRRFAALKANGLLEIRVKVRHDLKDPLDILEALIDANQHHRKKSKPQEAKEIAIQLEIEQERAKLRQQQGAAETNARLGRGETLPEPVPEAKGDARDIVAKKFNSSGKTVDRAASVGRALLAAEEKGDQATVQRLTRALDQRGYKGAFKELAAKPVTAELDVADRLDDQDGRLRAQGNTDEVVVDDRGVKSASGEGSKPKAATGTEQRGKKKHLEAIALLQAARTDVLKLRTTFRDLAQNRLCGKALRLFLTRSFLSDFDDTMERLGSVCQTAWEAIEFDL